MVTCASIVDQIKMPVVSSVRFVLESKNKENMWCGMANTYM